MSMTASITQRFAQQPRAVQWAILAAAAIVLFTVYNQYLFPVADGWNRSASAIQRSMDQVRAGESLTKDFQAMHDVVTTLGPVNIPGDEARGSAAVNALVNSVLSTHNATNTNFGFRSRGNLPKGSLLSVAREKRVERLTGDLKFTAPPKSAAAIIADLESSPDIEAIDSVRITRDAGGKVKVQLTLEAWVLSAEVSKGAV